MQFIQHYSSSRGNLYQVTANSGKSLLIECGVTWKNLLVALNYDLKGIRGCLLSHEHKDHSKAAESVLAAGIPIYATEGTFKALGLFSRRNIKCCLPEGSIDEIWHVGDFTVYPFRVNHDAADPLGFIVRVDDELLLFATDTAFITQKIISKLSIIAIECSYDSDTLETRVNTGDINQSLAERLLTSHMSKATAMAYLKDHCNLSKCREIHLLHCSADNLDKEATRKEVEDAFFIKTIIKGKDAVSETVQR